MEMILGQLPVTATDFSISSLVNWIMAGLLAIILLMLKKNGERAVSRENKIDLILETQQKQLHDHAITLVSHSEKINNFENDISERNKELIDNILTKFEAMNTGRRTKYDKH